MLVKIKKKSQVTIPSELVERWLMIGNTSLECPNINFLFCLEILYLCGFGRFLKAFPQTPFTSSWWFWAAILRSQTKIIVKICRK
jgi:hypothetical protein